MRRTTDRGVALIREFEGLRLNAYFCPAGVLTIGWGHTSAAGAPRVVAGMSIDKATAIRILNDDIDRFEDDIEKALGDTPTLPHEFDAMVSLAFNIGLKAFKGSSVLARFRRGDKAGAAAAFLMWNKATVKGVRVELPGLTRRRKAEKILFEGRFETDKLQWPRDIPMAQKVEADVPGKSLTKSTEVGAAGGTVVAGAGAAGAAYQAGKEAVKNAQEIKEAATSASAVFNLTGPMAILVGCAILMIAGAGYLIYQRYKRQQSGEQ